MCNFDCVYCECGWNRDGREDTRLPQPAELRSELERVLADCLEKGVRIDSITFSGDGEPTLNPHFPEMIDITLELRDKYFPDSVVSVLSNATLISRPGVREALMRVDNPILKLDAGIDSLALKMNQPSGHYSVRETVEAMKSFNGNFVLQTMFLKGPGINSLAADNLEAWRNIVRELRPREVMMYTLDRPAPAEGLEKVPVQSMEEAATPLIQEGFKVQIKG